ncbi:hypothetical protein CSUI_005800, partial [Cystoisospora suis]
MNSDGSVARMQLLLMRLHQQRYNEPQPLSSSPIPTTSSPSAAGQQGPESALVFTGGGAAGDSSQGSGEGGCQSAFHGGSSSFSAGLQKKDTSSSSLDQTGNSAPSQGRLLDNSNTSRHQPASSSPPLSTVSPAMMIHEVDGSSSSPSFPPDATSRPFRS